jgi:hypothetical protein
MTSPLFDAQDLPEPPTPAQAAQSMPAGKPRLRIPQRDQVEFHWASLDQLLDPDHPVRIIWAAVCALDLSVWLGEIKAVEGHIGRDATDPRLLVALWVYATIKGISSARELDKLCGPDGSLPFRWLCGGSCCLMAECYQVNRKPTRATLPLFLPLRDQVLSSDQNPYKLRPHAPSVCNATQVA